MKIRLAPEAEADLTATLEKLATDRVDGSEYQLTTGEVVRSWLIPPFRVFYVRRQDELHVLRVYHHARRPMVR